MHTRSARVVVWVVTTALGVALGTVTDPLSWTASASEILSALTLSPFLVTMLGGVGAPDSWMMMVLWPLGCCFWPLFSWLAYQWIHKATRWAWLAGGLLTFIAYFGLLTKFFTAMSA